jgi:hypothetical protein
MARRQRKVVSLRGAALPIPQVDREVVDALVDLLAEAMDGHIAGLAFAVVTPQGHTRSGTAGNAESHSMVAITSALAFRTMRRFDDIA